MNKKQQFWHSKVLNLEIVLWKLEGEEEPMWRIRNGDISGSTEMCNVERREVVDEISDSMDRIEKKFDEWVKE